MLCAKFVWNWPIGSGEDFMSSMYLHYMYTAIKPSNRKIFVKNLLKIYVKMHVHIVFNQNEYPRMELGFDITIYDSWMNMPIELVLD